MRNARIFYIGWLLLLISLSAGAQSGAQYYFEQGNQAYREENYSLALEFYEKILASGYEGASVYYNMGNCYYKLGQIGPAILHYEKARKLAPDDPELLSNLELANGRVKDRVELPPKFFLFQWWDQLKVAFTTPELTRIVMLFYVATMLLVMALLFLETNRWRQVATYLLAAFAALTIFSTYVLFVKVRAEDQNRQAIVLAASVNVLSAPNENSTDVFVLHEGVKVALNEQRGEWVKISLPDGKSGWLKRAYLGNI